MTNELEPTTTNGAPDGAAWTSSSSPAAPVVQPTRPRRSARLRWAVGLVVIALVVATTAGVALLISGRSSTATVLGYVPDGSVAYGEVRLDLPGDQRRAVGEFLSRFPGFADQAALDSKLDEVLDQLIKGASKGDQSYTANIKPWFDGELAFSIGPLPPATSLSSGDHAPLGSFRALALMSIKDPAAAQVWFDAAMAKSAATRTTEAYGGATLTVFAESGGARAAFAMLDGKVAVAGDIVSVKAAVDTKGAGRFAAAAAPRAALDSTTRDHVGFVYIGLRTLLDWSKDVVAASPSSSARQIAPLSDAMRTAIPDWGAYWLRIENDAVAMEAVAPNPVTRIGPTQDRASAVIARIPSTALVATTGNEFGTTLKQMLDLYRSDPTSKPILDRLDQALGLVGGADAALGWAGDMALVINDADGTPEGGLIVKPTDDAAAARVFTSLRTLIALGGAQLGITVRDETYAGSTISTLDLGDLAGMAGASTGVALPAGHVEIAYAVTGDLVVIGSGPGFVKHVLDTTEATSLASNGRYQKLSDRVGAGTRTTFVDVTAIRGLIEKAASGAADPTALARYEQDVKPFLLPFDAIIAAGSVKGDMTRSTVFITIK